MASFVPTMPVGALNVALSNFAQKYTNNALVGDAWAPRVPVARQAFQYVVFDRGDFQLLGSTLRAPGAEPGTVRMDYSVSPYTCQDHALKGNVPFESESYGLGLGFSTKQQLTQRLIARIALDREQAIANMMLSTANFPGGVTLSGTSMWDAYPAVANVGSDGSHPVDVVDAYKALLRQSGIQDAQMMLTLSDPVYVALKSHPDILARFLYRDGWSGSIGASQLTEVFGVKVTVASAIVLNKQNVANWAWGTGAVLGYSQPTPTMQDPSAAKTFVWTGGTDGEGNTLPGPINAPDGYGVVEWIDPDLSKKTYVQACSWYYGLEPTGPSAAIPILNCCAAPTLGVVPGDIEG